MIVRGFSNPGHRAPVVPRPFLAESAQATAPAERGPVSWPWPNLVVVALLLVLTGCGGDGDPPSDSPATPTVTSTVASDYGSGNVTDTGLVLVAPTAVSRSTELDQFGARMVIDGRCTTVRRHYSAVLATGPALSCLRAFDLLAEAGVLAADAETVRARHEHVDRFAVAEDRTSGSVELHGDFVLLLMENADGTFTLAVDTIASAGANQSINDVILSEGRFAS